MALAVRNEGSKVNSNINVTPMVDVMLVLLIVFMVITPMLQHGVSVDMARVLTWMVVVAVLCASAVAGVTSGSISGSSPCTLTMMSPDRFRATSAMRSVPL